MWYDKLNNKRLWKIFTEISAIPRESGNEEGIRQFLLSWAAEHDLKACTDKVGNVFIYTGGTKGKENDNPLCLQGHMDMVCVKTEDSAHDFLKDPIEIVCDGETVRAKDTSLGADNGIAMAMAMALAIDPELAHPPLELLFTVSEETGMNGANGLDSSKLESRRMINLDSEEEGIIYTGCAGGIEIDAVGKAKLKSVNKEKAAAYSLKVSGLLGGHSGGEIHKGRANAIKIVSRIMHRFPDYMISSLSGGTRRNVIPSTCCVTFVVDREDCSVIESIVSQVREEVRDEYSITDPGIDISLVRTDEIPDEAVKAKTSIAFMEALYLTVTGPQAMSAAVSGIVETSNNLAIVELADGKLTAISSTRSLIESARDECAYRVAAAYEDLGFKVSYTDAYPSWAPDPSSPLTKTVASLYKAYTKKKPVITSIHAGLECGIINSAVQGMDSISIGPNLFDVHSVNEHIMVDSAERTMGFLRYMLSRI